MLTILHEQGLPEALAWFGVAQSLKEELAFYSDNSLARELATKLGRFSKIGALSNPVIGKEVRAPSQEEIDEWRNYEATLKRYEIRVLFPGLPHEEMQVPPEIWPIAKVYQHAALEALELPPWDKVSVKSAIPLYNKEVYKKGISKLPETPIVIAVDLDDPMIQSGKEFSLEEILLPFCSAYANQVGITSSYLHWQTSSNNLTYFKEDACYQLDSLRVEEFLSLLEKGIFPVVLGYGDHWASHAAWSVGNKTTPCVFANHHDFSRYPLITAMRMISWDNSLGVDDIIGHLTSMGTFVGVEDTYHTPSNWRKSTQQARVE